MRKIPTLFVRDPNNRKYVLPEVTPGCEWVMNGEGIPTRKYDGTCMMLDLDGNWWARREVKPGKSEPPGFIAVQHDETTGKTVGWEPAGQSGFAKFFEEAVAIRDEWEVGTYELCGPKINGNPENFAAHRLVEHADAEVFGDAPLDFTRLRHFLLSQEAEGIVWHHSDGRMAKLKRRDFPPYDSDESAR